MRDFVVVDRGILKQSDEHFIAYQSVRFKEAAAKPGWLFIGGYASDFSGTKASFLWELALKTQTNCTLFDYFGCGQSSGHFEEGTIGRWKADVLSVLDHLTEGPQVLIGSSMGGWLMLLLARERSERVARMVGIASAPDFTEELFFNALSPEGKKALDQNGVAQVEKEGESPFTLTKLLVEEGRRHLVLNQTLLYPCPVFLLHGLQDTVVPWSYSQRLLQMIKAPFLSLTLIQNGDHSLSRDQDLGLLGQLIQADC